LKFYNWLLTLGSCLNWIEFHCYLLFAIWNFSPKLNRFLFDQSGRLRPAAGLNGETGTDHFGQIESALALRSLGRNEPPGWLRAVLPDLNDG
jgi:hypothetical protein